MHTLHTAHSEFKIAPEMHTGIVCRVHLGGPGAATYFGTKHKVDKVVK
jgi:hypothetical protein